MPKFFIQSRVIIASMALMMLLVSGIAQAQGDQKSREKYSREKIEAQKSAYITTELGLTTQESRDFWPVYDEYQLKKKKILKANKDKCFALQDRIDSLTTAQQEQLADCPIEFEQQLLDLKKEYHAKYKKLIPSLKLAKLYRAEREFKMVLMKQMRDNRGSGPGSGRPPREGGPGDGHHQGPAEHGGFWDLD